MQRYVAYGLSSLIALIPLSAAATSLVNPLGYTDLTQLLSEVLQAVTLIAMPFLVLFIVFIGFKFIAAQGNADELKKVRQMFFWAIVGALLVLGAQALSLAIGETVENLEEGVITR